ncbi:hypothetical protein HO173_006040 [Letharia columbiana]|uniref:Uncharacterized protein n=1 Tax=Letharia columbiana TaxID=112416 RepID=A0A8H6FW03_9LECA|nr:uncharacterized protein HO173_006040 [Letharia columbiana]KAF6235845.1 hypothetical protein HO173_006040 [Letharia columbiana]
MMEEDQSYPVLDPSGDLRLSTNTQDFVVSSKVMCLASPVWRAMFDPQGHWARHSSGVFSFPDDDSDALLIILQIAHLQFSDLPDALLIYEHLLQLAVLCDKYNTVRLVRPWISKWQAPLQAQAEECRQSGGEGYEGYETWLFIAWTFGDEAVFRKISRSLVLTSTVTTVNGEKRIVNAQGNMVGDIMPPGSVGAIIEARSERISALLEMCYGLVDRYESTTLMAPEDTTICTRRGHSPNGCDSLVYGCLIKGLQSLKLFPKRAEASDVESSVMAFADKLRSLRCLEYPVPDNGHGYYSNNGISHSRCGFTLAFANQIKAIIGQEEPSGVLEEHLTHLNEQKD